MSAITVFFRTLSLAGASVKRKMSELTGAPLNANCLRQEEFLRTNSRLSELVHSCKGVLIPEVQTDSAPAHLLPQSLRVS